MKKLLHVLHIEDSEEDSELAKELLLSNGLPCEIKRVDSRTRVFDALEGGSFDLILADCKLPGFSGLHALEIAHALVPEIPFIFLSGTIGEQTAIESLRNGATDYVLKDHLSRLAPAVRRALAEAEERSLCRQLQNRMREAGRLEAISTLSNGIAHDFNNILTIILGHASMLETEKARPTRVLEIGNTITQAARRAAEIVQQLMAFARKSDGHAIPTDLNKSVREHLPMLKATLPLKTSLSFEPTKELPNVLADATQVERILLNLVANSIESMPDGGNILLSTHLVSTTDLPDILPEVPSGNYVCLKVADTGIGMDSVTREHVFEPFFTTKDRGHGTGLGLPVVYGLMQAHNGCIQVDSALGEGTTVSLFFPVTEAKIPSARPVSIEQDPSLRGAETILVVEDEMDVSFFLETILTSHGYEILSAHDYDQAMKLFSQNRDRIHLVFSDIGLPRINGITLCSELKKLKPGLPVIIASGYSSREFQAGLDDLHNEAFLSKPFHTDEILKSVRKTLDGSAMTKSA
jgi:signal transduction histidine kinase